MIGQSCRTGLVVAILSLSACASAPPGGPSARAAQGPVEWEAQMADPSGPDREQDYLTSALGRLVSRAASRYHVLVRVWSERGYREEGRSLRG